MARMSEMAPGGRLHCGSPDHPAHMTRDTMYFLQEQNGFFVFGCRVCTEIHQQPQLHVVAASHGGRKIYKNTRKADHIDRNEQGRITSFR
jgi:Zn-finger protein